jgi:hypothetical protein
MARGATGLADWVRNIIRSAGPTPADFRKVSAANGSGPGGINRQLTRQPLAPVWKSPSSRGLWPARRDVSIGARRHGLIPRGAMLHGPECARRARRCSSSVITAANTQWRWKNESQPTHRRVRRASQQRGREVRPSCVADRALNRKAHYVYLSGVKIGHFCHSASALTAVSAIFERSASVFFSCCRVWSSSDTACL